MVIVLDLALKSALPLANPASPEVVPLAVSGTRVILAFCDNIPLTVLAPETSAAAAPPNNEPVANAPVPKPETKEEAILYLNCP